jgi:CRP/FNR family transcriptional regulator, cyclic AMP receptor protein
VSTPEESRPKAFLSQLNETSMQLLLQKAKNSGLRRGELLMRQGHPSNHVFIIESGGLLVFRADQDGAEVALDLLGAGGICGVEDVLCDRPYGLSARATTKTTCYSIPSHVIRRIISGDASAALAIANYVAVRLRLAERHIEILALDNTADRIERVLRRLARKSEPLSGNCRHLPLTQGDLASLVGISRQSVNRSLRGLRLRGIVTSHPRHIAVSEALLS